MELDHEQCAEVLTEVIAEQGELVFENKCDPGVPAWPSVSRIWKFRGKYYSDETLCEGEWGGPFDTLDEILTEDNEMFMALDPSNGPWEILTKELSPTQVAKRLVFSGEYERDDDESLWHFTINGETWKVTPKGNFRRVPE